MAPKGTIRCKFCGKTFTRNSDKTRHTMLNRCPRNPNPRVIKPLCQFCGNQFASQPSLDVHIKYNKCSVLRQQNQLPPVQPQPQPQPQQIREVIEHIEQAAESDVE